MSYTDGLQEFARRFVSDDEYRSAFQKDPDGAMAEFGLAGKIASSIRDVLVRDDIEMADGVAALKSTLKEPDSQLWI